MRWTLRLMMATVILAGCGGKPSDAAGFVNLTQHPDAALWGLWSAAQESVARQIDLNPIQQKANHAPPDLRPGDPRARTVQPRQIKVVAQPDVTAGELYTEAGVARNNPTGLIACPQPCNVRFAAAYSLYARRETRYARSWESHDDSFNLLLEYEFASHILYALGYDVKRR